MRFDLEQRRAWLSAGELAGFAIGPRESAGGASGLWRAQLGTHWHRQLRERASSETGAEFEVSVEGEIPHRGWTIVCSGRVDQLVRRDGGLLIREIKTVTRSLPAHDADLRAEHPGYFVQLAAYARLLQPSHPGASGELVFVEVSSGLIQRVPLGTSDADLLRSQLDCVAEFLDSRLAAAATRRSLRFRPPFAAFRHGQADALAALGAAAGSMAAPGHPSRSHPRILFEAPTGFGKTGVLLEFALGQLKAGRFDRIIYLTGKSTGQIQVMRTLEKMAAGADPLPVWQVRAKSEHCINPVFHCLKDCCPFIADVEERWPESGLSRFFSASGGDRGMESLREAGLQAGICPYEITRASLPYNDLWVGDYNYVFAPSNRGIFFEQPGFEPSDTLIIVDEAHNLPSRAADAHSYAFTFGDADALRSALHRIRVPAALALAWEHWTHFLSALQPAGALPAADESDARDLLAALDEQIMSTPLDRVALGPKATELIDRIPSAVGDLSLELPRLWWCAQAGTLRITCLDAAAAIGSALAQFGGAVLASATPGPVEAFSSACGLDQVARAEAPEPASAEGPEKLGSLGKRETRRLFGQLTTGGALLRDSPPPSCGLERIAATAPWRDNAYVVATDLRVDTTFQHRERHRSVTASTIEALQAASSREGMRAIAVFFPSYGYAEMILRALDSAGCGLRPALQPRLQDLAAQAAWVEASLESADALFLVLGSSFAESIDLLGGRVTHALVAGPALPEVNPVQRARLALHAPLGRAGSFRRVYQIPGMQKVNQALGRLVRAPGQRAKIVLHCRRFADPGYADLLAPEYRSETRLGDEEELSHWLARPWPPATGKD